MAQKRATRLYRRRRAKARQPGPTGPDGIALRALAATRPAGRGGPRPRAAAPRLTEAAGAGARAVRPAGARSAFLQPLRPPPEPRDRRARRRARADASDRSGTRPPTAAGQAAPRLPAKLRHGG